MSATTPGLGLPYPLPADTINVPRDMQALAQALEVVILNISASTTPPGTVSTTLAINPPPGWVLLDGTLILNGSTLYPALWAVIPPAMKQGADIKLPDARGRTIIGAGTGTTPIALTARTLLQSLGAESVALTPANLAAHTHPVDPVATAVTITDPGHFHTVDPSEVNINITDAGHTHGMNHGHSASTDGGGDHRHFASDGGAGLGMDFQGDHNHGAMTPGYSIITALVSAGGGLDFANPGPPNKATFRQEGTSTNGVHIHTIGGQTASAGHSHGATVGGFTGNVTPAGVGISGKVDFAPFNSNPKTTAITAAVDIAAFATTATGGDTAHANMQPSLALNIIMKT